MMNIYEKLGAIQSELKAPKGQTNKFGGYNYRSCEDIMEAVKPLLVKNATSLTVSDEIVMVGDRIYVKAKAYLFDNESEAAITTTAYAREEESKKGMDASQITGSASSYARKYALNGLFAIDDTKDADATNDHGKTKDSPFCEDCHAPVMPMPMSDGSVYPIDKVISLSKKRFGKVLCQACIEKAKGTANG